MDRIDIDLTLMTGSVIVGACVIAVLSMGYYSWQWLVGAVVSGLVLTWPSLYAMARFKGRDDAETDPRSRTRKDRNGDT